ncbi:MAG TPA: dienelactone hydrolase family protein [Puia sp.]|nr:dienelactone hydrolase family protein [Puia sp.]
MIKVIGAILIFNCTLVERMQAQTLKAPDTVSLQSGGLTLKALLWHPSGHGPFPTIIFCLGSYGGSDTLSNPEQQTSSIGPVFARNGYIFLGLFRRGVGLSKGQGENSADLMYRSFKEKGQEARNKTQLQHLETDQLQDMISGLALLRKMPDVDTNRIGVVGHSFGGSLALLLAEYDSGIKAVVVFAAAGYSWNLSPQLRIRLTNAVRRIAVPVLFIHAQNDYSTIPGYALDSVLNQLNKPHELKIYPRFGKSVDEGHNIIFLSIETWERDVFEFLVKNLSR